MSHVLKPATEEREILLFQGDFKIFLIREVIVYDNMVSKQNVI